jgi:hypothetical protein
MKTIIDGARNVPGVSLRDRICKAFGVRPILWRLGFAAIDFLKGPDYFGYEISSTPAAS